MNDDFISNILDSLERNIHISQENIDDFIGTLFEQRAEDMHTSVTKSENLYWYQFRNESIRYCKT